MAPYLERVVGKRAPRLLQLVERYATREPVRATLKGLVHHGRHARSKFVAHHLRDQVGEEVDRIWRSAEKLSTYVQTRRSHCVLLFSTCVACFIPDGRVLCTGSLH